MKLVGRIVSIALGITLIAGMSACDLFGGGSAIKVSGTIHLPAALEDSNGALSSGTYALYVGGYDPSLQPETAVTEIPLSDFESGWEKISVTYNPSTDKYVSYAFTVQGSGDYYLIAFLDSQADAALNLVPNGPPSEPFGSYPAIGTESGGPPVISVSDDISGAAIELQYLPSSSSK